MQPTMPADEYAALRFAIARGYCQDDERAYWRIRSVIHRAHATTLDTMLDALRTRYESKPITARLAWQYAHRCGD